MDDSEVREREERERERERERETRHFEPRVPINMHIRSLSLTGKHMDRSRYRVACRSAGAVRSAGAPQSQPEWDLRADGAWRIPGVL
jgi:hypothetical protein